MPPLNVLIKPVSSSCNLHCSYCFYMDIASNRTTANMGLMSLETLEQVMKRIFSYTNEACSIAWQGGEPTLAGLDFFRSYIELEKKYNAKGIPVYRSLQTNGYRLNPEWAAFLAKHQFLVGLSLDGIQETHDAYRKTPSGEGTFSSIMENIRVLDSYQVNYNILTVVNSKTAPRIGEIYHFYQEQGFHYQQYIACLDPLGKIQGLEPWSLSPEQYGRFLSELFDLWYLDCQRGAAPYIRQFENYIDLLLQIPPESCEQKGICGQQAVIEANGSVYPCDFYTTDESCLGNICSSSLEEMLQSPAALHFIQRSEPLPDKCQNCSYLPLCRNGCFRHRTDPSHINYFCEGYQMFFENSLPRLRELARKAISHR